MAAKVNGLIYPVHRPDSDGLGVHLTRTVSGLVFAGPTAIPVKDITNVKITTSVKDIVVGLNKFIDITEDDLTPAYVGIRPKHSSGDFKIERDGGMISLTGIESPGLTSCLAIGEYVRGMIDGN